MRSEQGHFPARGFCEELAAHCADSDKSCFLPNRDTYWVINGLLLSEMTETAHGMIQNFLYLVNR